MYKAILQCHCQLVILVIPLVLKQVGRKELVQKYNLGMAEKLFVLNYLEIFHDTGSWDFNVH